MYAINETLGGQFVLLATTTDVSQVTDKHFSKYCIEYTSP
jgi:hypothetical protein